MSEDDDGWYRSEDEPLQLHLWSLAYLHRIAVLANALYKGIVEGSPDGDLMRELAVALYNFEIKSVSCCDIQTDGPNIVQDLMETDFARVDLKDRVIRLWEVSE